MKKELLVKTIVISIVFLFIGMSICPTNVIGVNNRIIINNSNIDNDSRTTSDNWSKIFGRTLSDWGCSVQQTIDGGYIILGQSSPTYSKHEIWLIKTDSNGNKVWDKTFGDGNAWGVSVLQTMDGGFIIAGKLQNDIWLIKTDNNGNSEWDKTLGTGYSKEVIQTFDGGYVIVGGSDSNVLLIKTDSNGNKVWNKTFGDDEIDGDSGDSVKQLSDGGYIVTGRLENNDDIYDNLLLLRTDFDGELLWEKTYGGEKDDYGKYLQLTDDGGYIIVGGTEVNGYSSDDLWLLRTDSDGELLWNKKFGGENFDIGNSVEQTTDGGFIIVGITERDNTYYDGLLIKTDKDGNEEWRHIYGGRKGDTFDDVQQTTDGGYIITGIYKNNLLWLVKTDSNGNAPNTKIKTRIDFNLQLSRFLGRFPNAFPIIRFVVRGR